MKPIFKIGDKVTFYSTKGIITDVKQINKTTFEYTINNEYKTIQETDWNEQDWNDYITDKPYHKPYNIYPYATDYVEGIDEQGEHFSMFINEINVEL